MQSLMFLNGRVNDKYWNDFENVKTAINYIIEKNKGISINRTTFEQYNLRGLLEKYNDNIYMLLKICMSQGHEFNSCPWKYKAQNQEIMISQLPVGYFYNPKKPEIFNDIQKTHATQNVIRALNDLEENQNINFKELKKREFKNYHLSSLINFFKLGELIEFYETHKNDNFPDYSNSRVPYDEVVETRNFNISIENIILPNN